MKLFPYQVEGVKALVSKKRFLLRDEPGLGKTIQLIKAADVIEQMEEGKKVLVICPKSMVLTWYKEITKWSSNPSKFLVYNHDILITKKGRELLTEWDIVIADESHLYLKNIDTKRAAIFLDLIEKTKRVWLATATVASRSGEDYYCTLRVLLPSLIQKWPKGKFIRRYCREVSNPWSYSGKSYEGFQNMGELKEIFSKCSLKRTEADVKLELPSLTETDMPVPGVNDFTLEELADMKQRLLSGEGFRQDYQGKLEQSGLLKIDALVDLLNTYPKEKKCVVYCWHRAVVKGAVDAIRKKCEDRKVAYLSGEVTSMEKRQSVIDAFQQGDINTLVLNIQSGGAGITLTAATAGIYLQFPHSVIHWVQSRKRIHRIGSDRPVQIIKMMTEGGIDKDIFDVLSERMENIKQVEA